MSCATGFVVDIFQQKINNKIITLPPCWRITMKKLLIGLLALGSISSFANECGSVVEDLIEYKKDQSQFAFSTIKTYDNISKHFIEAWAEYSFYEGRSVYIPTKSFDTLKKSGKTVSKLKYDEIKRVTELNKRLDDLIRSVEDCI